MSAPLGNQPEYKADLLLLAGFLGAGKTTLLKRILSWETDLSETVVLVNEFGDIGIDGALLKDSGSDFFNKGVALWIAVPRSLIAIIF